MALPKAKKQIQLYGGVSDNLDSFLVPSPAVEYAENCHWRGKEGKLVKRLGSTKASVTSAPTSTEPPAILHPIGDVLYTFNGDQSYAYNATLDAWSARTQIPFFTTKEVATRSRVGEIVAHDFFVVRSGTYAGYAVFAYSTKDTTTVTITDAEGTVRLTEDISDASFPSIVASGTGLSCHIITFKPSTSILETRLVSTSFFAIGAAQTVASDVYDGDSKAFGSSTDDQRALETGFPVYCIVTPSDDVSYRGGLNRILIYTKGTTGSLWVLRSSDGFENMDSDFEITTTSDYARALAVCYDDDTSHYYVLYNRHNTGAPDTNNLRIERYAYNAASAAAVVNEATEILGAPGTVPNVVVGAIAYNDATAKVEWAVTVTPDYFYERVGTYFGTYSSTLTSPSSTAYVSHHRLTTNMIYHNSEMYVGMQMSALPDVLQSEASTDTPDSFAGYLVPVTNTIVRCTDITQLEVTCGVDTNQSKHLDFTGAYNSGQLGRLAYTSADNKLAFTSREIFTAESVYSHASSSINRHMEKLGSAQSRANAYLVTFSQSSSLPGVALGDGLIVPAGAPAWFDGDVLCELSPLAAPQITRINDARTQDVQYAYEIKDSTKAAGPYWRKVQAIVGYTDASGNIHRSAPSALVYAYGLVPENTAAEPYEQGYAAEVTLAAPMTMNLTGNANRYFAEIYVSDDETGSPRLAGRQTFTPDGTAFSVQFSNSARTTGSADANTLPVVRNTPFIYTKGGVLASDPWPNFSHGVATSQRFWAISAEDQGQVYYSKIFEELTGPEFNAALVISLGDERKLTAIGKLDDKVVVFEKNDIHVIYGPGPDNAGVAGRSGGFDVHHVTSDVGCDEPASVVETSEGLIFKSRRGFYLLDRGLQLQFIGGGVQDITRNTRVITAHIVPEFAEVRFHLETTSSQVPATGPDADAAVLLERPARPKFGNVLPTNGCVVFNYELGRWSVFSNYPAAVAALTADGKYARILDDWTVYIEASEEDDIWRDGTTNVYQKIITPHIPLADAVQGYSRCRRVSLLGRYMSSFAADSSGNIMAGNIKVTPRYDYEATDGAARTWRANEELQGGVDRLQIRMVPERQKCQSIQLTIEETDTAAYHVYEEAGVTYSPGRGFEIVTVEFDLGLKEGPVRSLGAKRKQ